MSYKIFRHPFLFLLFVICANASGAQTDTLRVMGYNVLYYGNGCQGPNGRYHTYLKTIAGFTNPDIISLEKMASIPVSADDKNATAPIGFADSILAYAFNAAFPGRYAYCPFTNASRSNNMAVLFYDQHKLGFVSIVSSYANLTDFNTYKLYYKDPNLAKTHDTTFLYLTLNHDKSGDENEAVRGAQIAEEMKHIKEHFTRLPNMINIGDFNLHSSSESCYQALTQPADTNFRFSDPPFFPDHIFSYPAEWNHNPDFAAYFTTSTRESAGIPNSCGTGGGAKGWYDHIFVSDWLVNNTDYIRYIPHSYHTVGNDGNRFKISIDNRNTHINNAAPPDVIEALYQMSNKYPVMLSLEVTPNTKGTGPANPEIAGVKIFTREEITLDNPVNDQLIIHLPDAMKGEEISLECVDADGNSRMKKKLNTKNTDIHLNCKLAPGTYTARFYTEHNTITEIKFTKQ